MRWEYLSLRRHYDGGTRSFKWRAAGAAADHYNDLLAKRGAKVGASPIDVMQEDLVPDGWELVAIQDISRILAEGGMDAIGGQSQTQDDVRFWFKRPGVSDIDESSSDSVPA
jgi:hypothetical protein